MPHTSPYTRLLHSYPFISPSKYTSTLSGQNVLITGCSVGIGRATATAFAAAGATTVCVARRLPEITTLASTINATGTAGKAYALQGDVCAPGAAKKIVSEAEKLFNGPVDVLVNVAGRARISPLDVEDEELGKWWGVYELNVLAPTRMIRQVLPGMIGRGRGTVVTVSSAVGSLDLPVMTAYSSSKAAITKVHESLAPELEGTGVLVYAVNPGMVRTELGAADDALNREAMEHPAMKAFLATVGSGTEMSDPELPADTMVALVADPRAKKLTGLHINADQNLEDVFDEIEKEGGGRIHKDELYRVRINQLVVC